jgi:hypothetical protein
VASTGLAVPVDARRTRDANKRLLVRGGTLAALGGAVKVVLMPGHRAIGGHGAIGRLAF